MSKEIRWGRLSGTHLQAMFYGPSWRFPRNLWKWGCWSFWISPYKGNYRCYCHAGLAICGRIVLAGYGTTFWFSRFHQPTPCPCDVAMMEMRHDPNGPLYDAGCDCEEGPLCPAILHPEDRL